MNKSIFIKDSMSNDTILRIETKDITFITSTETHTVVNTQRAQYVIEKGMNSLEINTLLGQFVRVNKKMCVNINHIDCIEQKNRILIGANSIQIEPEYKNDFFLRITILE